MAELSFKIHVSYFASKVSRHKTTKTAVYLLWWVKYTTSPMVHTVTQFSQHNTCQGLTSSIMVNWIPILGIDVCGYKCLVISQGEVQEIKVKSKYLPHYCSIKSPLSTGVWGSGMQLTSALAQFHCLRCIQTTLYQTTSYGNHISSIICCPLNSTPHIIKRM